MERQRPHTSLLIIGIGSMGIWGLAGCGSRPVVKKENQTALHLRAITQAYDVAMMEARRAPRDLEDLKRFLKQVLKEDQDPEAWLRSPNDGQPYEIIFGVNLERGDADPNSLIAYEKEGANGKRVGITVSRIVKEMSDAEFSEARLANGGRPAKGK